MPSTTTVTAIAGVITIPLIFTLLGGGRNAGLIIGVVLVVIGVAWSVIGSSGRGDEE
jgi:drug/metabolite transporter (DMT)-like permease